MRPRRLACGDARDLLAERADRVLDDREREDLDAHLAGCGPCATEAAELDRVDALLRAMETEDPGAPFTDEVIRRLDRAPGGVPVPPLLPPLPGPERILRGVAFAAGTAVVAALAAAILPSTPAAGALGEILPALPGGSLAGIPDVAGWTTAGIGGALPSWAAPAGAAAAALALGIQLATLRGRRGG